MSTHFKIIVPMYNCSLFAKGCLDSVFRQKYDNWQMVVIVEPCDDDTYEVAKNHLTGRDIGDVLLVKNTERLYVPKNHIEGIRVSCPDNDDVIVCLDGDDRLHDDEVLSYLDSVYQSDDVWITWGSYVFEHDLNRIGLASRPFPDSLRPREWRYSHLKTFRHFLFKGIRDVDLRDAQTGDYYRTAGDMALMYPMVEMAGKEHGRFLERPLYVYNQSTPYNDEKIHAKETKRCHVQIHNRTPYELKTKESLCR